MDASFLRRTVVIAADTPFIRGKEIVFRSLSLERDALKEKRRKSIKGWVQAQEIECHSLLSYRGGDTIMRLLIFSLIGLAYVLSSGCFNNSDKAPKASSQAIGEVKLYVFSAHHDDFLRVARPLIVLASTSIKDTLDVLGRELATSYFAKTYKDKATDIHFEVRRVHEITTPYRLLRIAVVNMIDKEEDAVRYFFQGSAGAQTSFYMLTATFLQPHLRPPLLDGLVLLYNGKILP